jgi:hypothetical protein
VVLVPNAALRWSPSPLQIAPDARQTQAGTGKHHGGSDSSPATAPADAGDSPRTRGTVWVQDGAFVRPVYLRTGPTDGINTEVLSSRQNKLEEGMELIVGELHPDEIAAGTTNPFIPQIPKPPGPR